MGKCWKAWPSQWKQLVSKFVELTAHEAVDEPEAPVNRFLLYRLWRPVWVRNGRANPSFQKARLQRMGKTVDLGWFLPDLHEVFPFSRQVFVACTAWVRNLQYVPAVDG